MSDPAQTDKQYVWHPFTQMQDWAKDELLVIESGSGAKLRDTQGREYLDGVSSLWCNVHGHRRPEIDAGIRQQLDQVAHSTLLGLVSPPSALLAERLAKIAPPGLSKVFYSDSGATAVEIAIKMALQYWKQRRDPRPAKTKYVSIRNAYHGDTLGAVSVGGVDLFHEAFRPLLFETLRAPSPYERPPPGQAPEQHLRNCVQGLEGLLREHADEVAAMILEPLVQGAAGMLMSPSGYLEAARALCTKYDVLLIVDEVATGFGRTGKMFACEHEGVSPDLMALGKGLTGGYLPVAATLATEEIYGAFLGEYQDFRTFFHGHTFTGNALGCAAAIASLEIFERDRVIEGLQPKIELLRRRLREEFSPLAHVGEIRQCGFIAGVELSQERDPLTAYPFEEQMGMRVCRRAREYGILTRPLRDTIVIMPPLCISIEELNKLLDGLYRAIGDVTEGGRR